MSDDVPKTRDGCLLRAMILVVGLYGAGSWLGLFFTMGLGETSRPIAWTMLVTALLAVLWTLVAITLTRLGILLAYAASALQLAVAEGVAVILWSISYAPTPASFVSGVATMGVVPAVMAMLSFAAGRTIAPPERKQMRLRLAARRPTPRVTESDPPVADGR